jgi:hypothetical protein
LLARIVGASSRFEDRQSAERKAIGFVATIPRGARYEID